MTDQDHDILARWNAGQAAEQIVAELQVEGWAVRRIIDKIGDRRFERPDFADYSVLTIDKAYKAAALYRDGQAYKAIAAALDVPRPSVGRLLKMAEEAGQVLQRRSSAE